MGCIDKIVVIGFSCTPKSTIMEMTVNQKQELDKHQDFNDKLEITNTYIEIETPIVEYKDVQTKRRERRKNIGNNDSTTQY